MTFLGGVWASGIGCAGGDTIDGNFGPFGVGPCWGRGELGGIWRVLVRMLLM